MPFTIVRQDITKMKVDAIINAANTELAMGGGVCGAIFKAAGPKKLQAACDRLGPIKTGSAVITSGYNLPAKYIIHTPGPIYGRQSPQESENLLRSSYSNSLALAVEYKCETIAFPLISSGIYGYPKVEALQVATHVIRNFLNSNELDIYLAIFDRKSFTISKDILGDVTSYIDDYYADARSLRRQVLHEEEREDIPLSSISAPREIIKSFYKPTGIDNLVDNLAESFSQTLLRLIDIKGKNDVDVYKRANLDRKLFSKIRTGKGYLPSKRTAIALAVALELDLDETDDLLKRAGYALSHSQKFDVIVEYFIITGHYDVLAINEVLFKYDLPTLGS